MAKKSPSASSSPLTIRLAESGLTPADITPLELEYLPGPEVQRLSRAFANVGAIKIPYFDVNGSPLSSQPGLPPFYRLRYVEKQVTFDQGTTKQQRYTQLPGSGVCAYFPRLIDWRPIVNDPTQFIMITEGEFKAAKACKEGFPTIGLGGVYNWRSSKSGILFLPELAALNWARRDVYIVFDSDFKSNEHVCAALVALAEELYTRGANPWMTTLPQSGEKKVGLDDYLLAEGPEKFASLVSESEPLTISRELWRMNDSVVYVRDPGLVASLISPTEFQKISPAAFKEHSSWATKSVPERVISKDGQATLKSVSAAPAWLRWGFRREVHRMTYKPGATRFMDDRGQPALNLWPGWGTSPKSGDVGPFLALVSHIFQGAEPEAMGWFLDWCAHPIQYPGAKLFSAVVIYGTRHGTGKSLLGYTLGSIYGKNFTEIRQGDLHASFNEWSECKQLVLGDDVTGSNKRQDADLLKKLITQKELRVNPKYIPSYVVPDCINYIFTSNQPDSFFLEEDDRRFFIHEVIVSPLDEEFYIEYQLWLDSGGAAALFDWFLKRDIAAFNPAAPAFKTRARSRMIADVRSDLGSWIERLRIDPASVLRVGDHALEAPLMTSSQLMSVYLNGSEQRHLTANGVARELRRQNMPMANGGEPLNAGAGPERYYIVYDQARWLNATKAEVIKEIKSQVVQPFAAPARY